MIKKIWNDPVWSKVLAAGFISLFGYIILIIYSWYQSVSLAQTWKDLQPYKVELAISLFVLLLITIIVAIRQMNKIAELKAKQAVEELNEVFPERYKKYNSTYWPAEKNSIWTGKPIKRK